MRRVLVTGGAGFMGSELVNQLANRNFEVIIVDNLVNGRRENVENFLSDRVQLVVADIRDSDRMGKLIQGMNIIYHLACLGVRHSIHSPYENHEVNATATLKLLMLARAADVKRFVYISSSEVYGTAQWAPMSEEHPTNPMTVYGSSKLAGECYTLAFYRTYGFKSVVIRPFNIYGPRCHYEGDCAEVIPRFLLRCMAGRPMVIFGDGTQTRDFTHVSDTARGIIMASLMDETVGETINLGSGLEVYINDLAREVAAVVGRPQASIVYDDPRPGDVFRLKANTEKARRLLGFEPTIKLREGLTTLRDWYLSSGQSPEVLLEQEIVRNWEFQQDKKK